MQKIMKSEAQNVVGGTHYIIDEITYAYGVGAAGTVACIQTTARYKADKNGEKQSHISTTTQEVANAFCGGSAG